MQNSWPSDQRREAKKQGKALFTVAIDGNKSDKKTGRYESYGPANTELARIAFFFGLKVTHEFEGRKKPPTKDQIVKLLAKIIDDERSQPAARKADA